MTTWAICAECGAEIVSHDCDLHLIESDPQTDEEREAELQDIAERLAYDSHREQP